MGFREFAKDYKIEYVDVPGRKRPKPVRVYVGPWFRFKSSAETVRSLKWFYLFGLLITAAMILIPMCIDCPFTRLWYVQVPAAIASIPWIFAACATWRLWTAKEKVDREHNLLTGRRMRTSCLIMSGFCLTSVAGCVYALLTRTPVIQDFLICTCCALSAVCAVVLFARSKLLEMVQIEE